MLDQSATIRERVGLALASAAALLLQTSLTRVLSVALWHHFGFLLVGLSLLGIGASGVALALWPRMLRVPPARLLPALALAQAAATVVAYLALTRLPLEPFRLLDDPGQFFWMPLAAICTAAPFVAFGLLAGALLTVRRASASGLYVADLAGASAGCFAVALAMPALGGEGTVIAAAAGAAAAAAAFSDLRVARTRALIALAAALALGVAAPFAGRLLPLRITDGKKTYDGALMNDVLRDPTRTTFTGWNTYSRVDVVRYATETRIAIDAGTAACRVPTAGGFSSRDLHVDAALALAARPPRVLVLGSCAGWELAQLVAAGAPLSVGVEVNELLTGLLLGPLAAETGHLAAAPAVRIVTDEGRSWLARASDRFDVVMSAHTISNAAISAGGLGMVESYLLTREAVDAMFAHVDPGGGLVFARPRAQIAPFAATIAASLAARGAADPAAHMAALEQSPFYAVLVVGLEPLSPALQTALRALAARGAAVLSRPYLGPAALDDATRALVVTDDRPFVRTAASAEGAAGGLRGLLDVFKEGDRARMSVEDRPVAEAAMLLLLLQAIVLGGVLLLLPIRRSPPGAGSPPVLLYFFALGLAYVTVELVLVQGLTLLVGQPVYSLAGVLAGLLLGSSIGAGVSGRFGDRIEAKPSDLKWAPLIAAGAAVAGALAVGPFGRALLPLPLAARVVIAVAAAVPIGAAMGAPFPLGLRACGADRLVPWAWAVNGFASVVGSVAAAWMGLTLGLRAAGTVGAAAYVLAALAASRWRRPSSS